MASDPVFNASSHNILSLEKILQSDPKEIDDLATEFKTRGWCIVRLPYGKIKSNVETHEWIYREDLDFSSIYFSQQMVSSLDSFFSMDESQKNESYGYSSVPHKESFHITSPIWGENEAVTGDLRMLVDKWERFTNTLSMDLVELFCNPLFGCDKATLSHRADIPLAYGLNHVMMDVAYYKNEKTATLSPAVGRSTKDVNCVPHYDPGFLSLSFLSTHDGLQLQDPATRTWYAGPVNTREGQEDLAVIWLGSAAATASKGQFKAGVHRVVYPQTKAPRIAAWFEICTLEQVNEEIKSTVQTQGSLKIPNLPGSKAINMRGDVRLIERYYGVPRSKVMTRSDNFSVYYSKDEKDPYAHLKKKKKAPFFSLKRWF